jgi:polygalacturonase
MILDRRSLLLGGTIGAAALLVGRSARALTPADRARGWVDVRDFGAKGDGVTIDSPAINKAIDHAAARGGGTVWFPAGTWASYTIRLKSKVTLHLDNGATILAAPAPQDGRGGYDLAEPMDPAISGFQDFGHSHWKNSLIWGEGLHDIAITGQGLIWGKGLGRGDGKDAWLKDPNGPGTGNKAIALKNCRNVTLRDFKILEGGWFALLATGVDNLTIDNVLVDTNRDGFDIDCCKNVRVSNCTVNSPWDDAICPKSSYALGMPRVTENVTISNCLVTGNYQVGSVLDGTWRKMPPEFAKDIHGRIKFGTETNGGFRNITITNCIFEDSRGLAFQTVDGGMVEDVTVSNLTMRGIVNAPFFLRLGKRMRGPAGRPIGTMRRISIENVVSSGANLLPSVIAGLNGHPIEDLHFANIHLQHVGGAPAAMAAVQPPEAELGYPEATMFGDLPATGFFIRHARRVSMRDVEVAVIAPDPRPAFRLEDVEDADFTGVRVPKGPAFSLEKVVGFRSTGSRWLKDRMIDGPVSGVF